MLEYKKNKFHQFKIARVYQKSINPQMTITKPVQNTMQSFFGSETMKSIKKCISISAPVLYQS